MPVILRLDVRELEYLRISPGQLRYAIERALESYDFHIDDNFNDRSVVISASPRVIDMWERRKRKPILDLNGTKFAFHMPMQYEPFPSFEADPPKLTPVPAKQKPTKKLLLL